MTTSFNSTESECPVESIIKLLSGKWKAQIFKRVLEGPVRFSGLLKTLEGANKQSLATALREMEEAELLEKKVVKLKPLHVEYSLTTKGQQYIEFFRQAEKLLP